MTQNTEKQRLEQKRKHNTRGKIVGYIKSQFRYVSGVRMYDGTIFWQNNCTKNLKTVITKMFSTEREAAKAADVWLIQHGRQPVNVLKAKIN